MTAHTLFLAAVFRVHADHQRRKQQTAYWRQYRTRLLARWEMAQKAA